MEREWGGRRAWLRRSALVRTDACLWDDRRQTSRRFFFICCRTARHQCTRVRFSRSRHHLLSIYRMNGIPPCLLGHKVPGELVNIYESRLPFLVAEASRRHSADDDRIGWPASIPSVWQSRLRTLRAFE